MYKVKYSPFVARPASASPRRSASVKRLVGQAGGGGSASWQCLRVARPSPKASGRRALRVGEL